VGCVVSLGLCFPTFRWNLVPSTVEWGIFANNCRASVSFLKKQLINSQLFTERNRSKGFPILGNEGM